MSLGEDLEEKIVEPLDKHIDLVKGENSPYEDSGDFLVWAWAGISEISLTEAAEELKYLDYNVPSGDTVLQRIKDQPYQILEQGFDNILKDLLNQAKKQRLFQKPVTLAIDYTKIEWYGEDLPFITKSRSKNGTNKFISFATIAVVEDGKRYTLKALPVTPNTNKKGVVQELIEFAQDLVNIRTVLFDRGFYTNDVIRTVKSLDENFVMPAKKYDKVENKMEEALNSSVEYEMSEGATYKLKVVEEEEDEGSSKLLPYATNMNVSADRVHEYYSRRFGIETQYRVKNRFLGRTSSKDFSVRYSFFVLALCLYNIWVLLNIAERGREGLDHGRVPIRVDWLKHIFRVHVIQGGS